MLNKLLMFLQISFYILILNLHFIDLRINNFNFYMKIIDNQIYFKY